MSTSDRLRPTLSEMSDRNPRSDPNWWREGVIYQVYPRSFQDSDGDGIGDLRGIISRLDHLRGGPLSLNVDAIWISPFYPSPMADFGYDVTDYCDVDPIFGSLADFDDLLAAAHERGLRVIVDLVPNHTSDRHPWFIEARASRSNPKRDWYVWADPKADGSPPNNWRMAFSGVDRPAWTLDRVTSQYYLHSFLPEQPDLNWWNPEVRQAFDAILRFWLDRGVDGFRIDVAHRMARDPDLRDNPIYPVMPGEPLAFWTDEERPMDQDHPEVHAIHRRFRRTLDEYPGSVAIGEVFILDTRRLVRYYGETGDQLHLAFNFAFLRAPWTADAFREQVALFEALLPAAGWPNYTLSNHDNPRTVSRYAPSGDVERGRRRARLAAVMLLTLRGTAFLYNGEEIGMADGPVPLERVVDVAGRDPARTPMQWDGSSHGGFTTSEPWLPVNPETARVNAADQREMPGSILDLYRSLIALRRETPALRRGDYRAVEPVPDGVFAYLREFEGERWFVALNFGDVPVRLVLPPADSGSQPTGAVRLSTDPSRPLGRTPAALELDADEGLVVELGP